MNETQIENRRAALSHAVRDRFVPSSGMTAGKQKDPTEVVGDAEAFYRFLSGPEGEPAAGKPLVAELTLDISSALEQVVRLREEIGRAVRAGTTGVGVDPEFVTDRIIQKLIEQAEVG